MNTMQRFVRRATLALALFSLSACAGLGSLEQVLGELGGLGGGEVRGEIRYVDDRRREIEIDSNHRGAERVRYDSRTEVVYQNRRYSVRDLERGDLVSARVQRDSRGDLIADRIRVERSVQDRRGGGVYDDVYDDDRGRVERFQGRVGRIDLQRGWFQLQQGYGDTYTVVMPYNPSNSDLSRFRRLRSGDSVRFDGTRVNRSRIELSRFR